jgi:hypothetical protein
MHESLVTIAIKNIIIKHIISFVIYYI